MRDLDEYSTAELEAELQRREKANKRGCCDYCHRPRAAAPCRFPKRHLGVPDAPADIFVNGRRIHIDATYLSYNALVNLAGKTGQHWTMTCFYPSTGKNCTVLPGEYVTVRDGMRIDIANTGAA